MLFAIVVVRLRLLGMIKFSVVAVAACGQWFTYVPEVDFGNITDPPFLSSRSSCFVKRLNDT